MTDVLLVTCAALPDGEDGGGLLLEALAQRGLAAEWVAWDDGAVDWAGASLAMVRSTWDYTRRREEFLGWARDAERLTRLVHGSGVLAWNTDKSYLCDLAAAGLPVVPTVVVETAADLDATAAGLGSGFGSGVRPESSVVVKPRVGAGGRGVEVYDGGPVTSPGPWVVQPLVESVRSEGETSVFVLGGRATSQVRKLPGDGEVRVHEEYGGRTVRASSDAECARLAESTVRVAQELLGSRLHYARVDLMRAADGELVVGELEVAEPGLYLDVVPEVAEQFVDMVAGLLA